jgi:hypothetical protein
MAGQRRDNALDHVVVVVFENRSLDNVLGRLYGQGDGKTFGIRAYAEQHNIQIEGLPDDPNARVPPEQALHIIHNFLAIQFPLLHPTARERAPRPDPM